LRENGHTVFGLARSAQAARALLETGAEPIAADALDAASVATAILRIQPQAVINELTSLPTHYTPAEMKAAAERDRRVRTEGNANLLAALPDAGVQRYLLQSSGFWYAPGAGLADEAASFAWRRRLGLQPARKRTPNWSRQRCTARVWYLLLSATDSFTAPVLGTQAKVIWASSCARVRSPSSEAARVCGASCTLRMPQQQRRLR
jgi:nucleoside-diphosphate-sugar epimerase